MWSQELSSHPYEWQETNYLSHFILLYSHQPVVHNNKEQKFRNQIQNWTQNSYVQVGILTFRLTTSSKYINTYWLYLYIL